MSVAKTSCPISRPPSIELATSIQHKPCWQVKRCRLVSLNFLRFSYRAAVQSLKLFDESLGAALKQRRFIALLLAIFLASAVLLAAIGCYGVLNYWVSSRKQEIAIRMTMGAGTLAVIRCTGKQAATLGALGLAIGFAGSLFASRWVSSMVFGITAHDPVVLCLAAFGALLMVLSAAAIPIWRATRIIPIETLHEA